MREELTTKMHMEFCNTDDERLELAAMAVFSDMRKGNSLSDSLKKYGISAEDYEKHKP